MSINSRTNCGFFIHWNTIQLWKQVNHSYARQSKWPSKTCSVKEARYSIYTERCHFYKARKQEKLQCLGMSAWVVKLQKRKARHHHHRSRDNSWGRGRGKWGRGTFYFLTLAVVTQVCFTKIHWAVTFFPLCIFPIRSMSTFFLALNKSVLKKWLKRTIWTSLPPYIQTYLFLFNGWVHRPSAHLQSFLYEGTFNLFPKFCCFKKKML